jgi:hypothetical protein
MIDASAYPAETVSYLNHFFGKPLAEVSLLPGLIALQSIDPPPKWLRGKTTFGDLPRVSLDPLSHRVVVPLIHRDEYAPRVRWIIETLSGRWSLDHDGFSFETLRDAKAYEAHWGTF